MKIKLVLVSVFFCQFSLAQISDNKFKDKNPLKELGVNLIWMTLEPTSVLQHSSVDIFFPTLSELKLASKDTTVSEDVRKIFSSVSKDELTYVVPYSALLFNITRAVETIFLDPNNPVEARNKAQKTLEKLFENLKSNNFSFKIIENKEKSYIERNLLSNKVTTCEIIIPSIDNKSVKFYYFCYKYGQVYKVGLPGKLINWGFIYAENL